MKKLILIAAFAALSTNAIAKPTPEEWKRGGTDAYPFNIDLIAHPQPTDPNNANLTNWLYSHPGGSPGRYTVNAKDWTYAWYWFEDATTMTCATAGGSYNLPQIPWNPTWKVPGGTDAQVIITDRNTGREIMLYGVSATSANPCKVTASTINNVGQDTTYGNDTPADYRLKDNGWVPAWAPGIPYTKRITTRAELERGAVNHALSMPSNMEARTFVAPAIESDGPGKDGTSYPIPAGQRFQLNPNKWSDSSCNTWAANKNANAAIKDIAAKLCKGLLHYGVFISDKSGVSHIQLEADSSANWNTYCVSGSCASASGLSTVLDGLITSPSDWVAIVPSNKYVSTPPVEPPPVEPPPVEPPPVSNNLALNKPATASSVQSNNYLPALAVDGKITTRWSSAYSDPQLITIDLQNNYNINKVVIEWEYAYAKSYSIQLSKDNINWTIASSVSNSDGGNDTIILSSNDARYIRVYGTTRATRYGYSIWELQVFGTLVGTPPKDCSVEEKAVESAENTVSIAESNVSAKQAELIAAQVNLTNAQTILTNAQNNLEEAQSELNACQQ